MSSAPYFTSRKRTTFTRPAIHARAAGLGNKNELFRSLHTLNDRVADLEGRAGTGSISLKSSSPVSAPPPAARFNVSTKPGVFIVEVHNPEFIGKGNLPRTPIQHRIEFSATADFRNPDTLPIGQQTYYEVSKYSSGQRKWLATSSSHDGTHFNQRQISGPFTN